MRVVAVSVVAAALAAGAAALLAGTAPASHLAVSLAVQSASWSPNGKQIAFGYDRNVEAGSNIGGFRIVRRSSRPGGPSRTVLTEKSDDLLQTLWPSRGRILFLTGGGALRVVRVHGGKPQRVVFPDCQPIGCTEEGSILSPNRKIAAVQTCNWCGDPHTTNPFGIELLKFTAGRPVVLPNPVTTKEDEVGFDDEILAFSPDGSQLVFRRTGSDGSALMAFRFGSDQPVPLAQSGIPGASLVPSDATQVQWSPNGRWVAYNQNKNLEVVPTAGGTAPRALAPACALSWSPTSKLIACTGSRLITIRPDGTHRTNLLKGRHFLLGSDLQWSPDGSRLLFTAGPYDYLYHVWTVRPNGRELIRLG